MNECGLYEMPRERAEALGRLAPGVVHDLNNLLSVVMAAIDLMELEAPNVGPLATTMREAIERAALMHQQLLAFARRGEMSRPESVDLSEAVSDLRGVLGLLAGPSIRINYSLHTRSSRVALSRGSVDQILVNLVANARDAMPDGGDIDILVSDAAERGGRMVILDVSDEGVGMDHDVIARIFDPFFTTKRAWDGGGLGLHVVRCLVESVGGRIDVTSVPGGGSRFRLIFPTGLGVVPRSSDKAAR
jgi:signal transduction histidine kinase